MSVSVCLYLSIRQHTSAYVRGIRYRRPAPLLTCLLCPSGCHCKSIAYATCPLAYASLSAPVSYVLAGGECRVGSREGRGCKEVEVGARQLQDSYRLAPTARQALSSAPASLSLSLSLSVSVSVSFSLCLSLLLPLSLSLEGLWK